MRAFGNDLVHKQPLSSDAIDNDSVTGLSIQDLAIFLDPAPYLRAICEARLEFSKPPRWSIDADGRRQTRI